MQSMHFETGRDGKIGPSRKGGHFRPVGDEPFRRELYLPEPPPKFPHRASRHRFYPPWRWRVSLSQIKNAKDLWQEDRRSGRWKGDLHSNDGDLSARDRTVAAPAPVLEAARAAWGSKTPWRAALRPSNGAMTAQTRRRALYRLGIATQTSAGRMTRAANTTLKFLSCHRRGANLLP